MWYVDMQRTVAMGTYSHCTEWRQLVVVCRCVEESCHGNCTVIVKSGDSWL